jgi:hypothetical protein
MINAEKLIAELIAAGIVTSGCNSNGIVWDIEGNEIQSRTDVAEVIGTHDPTPIVQTIQNFKLPIQAPQMIAEEFVLQSPKPQDTAELALGKIKELAVATDKPIGEIILNMVVCMVKMDEEIKILKAK